MSILFTAKQLRLLFSFEMICHFLNIVRYYCTLSFMYLIVYVLHHLEKSSFQTRYSYPETEALLDLHLTKWNRELPLEL